MANQHARVRMSQVMEGIFLAWPLGCEKVWEAQIHSDDSIELRNCDELSRDEYYYGVGGVGEALVGSGSALRSLNFGLEHSEFPTIKLRLWLAARVRCVVSWVVVTMSSTTITPAPLQGQEAATPAVRQVTLTAKEKKYDRQLRLWAASGQQALEDASILLLNSGAGVVGIETLKNLILPGVGQFTIVDEAKVQESDLGANFFLAEDSLGKSRADETCNYLRELNPEVRGSGIREVSRTVRWRPSRGLLTEAVNIRFH